MKDEFSIHRLIITGIIVETNEAKTFVLKPLDGWKPVYEPGQFITLNFTTKHGEKRRSYSISSAPDLEEHISITVKRVENGEFSRLLISQARINDILYTTGISGRFLLPTETNGEYQYFFIAAGSGITPCYSMIKTLLSTTPNRIVLIYSNRSEADVIFYEAIKSLALRYNRRFVVQFLFSSLNDVMKSRLSNWLLDQLMKTYMSGPTEKTFCYLCGPFDFMQMAAISLSTRIPYTNIYKENFSTLPRPVKNVPPDKSPQLVSIKINGEVSILTVEYPDTILAAAKKQKLLLPYSCEAGRCGSCTANLIEGNVWMAYNEVLTDEEVANGLMLVCQAYPIYGAVEIEY